MTMVPSEPAAGHEGAIVKEAHERETTGGALESARAADDGVLFRHTPKCAVRTR